MKLLVLLNDVSNRHICIYSEKYGSRTSKSKCYVSNSIQFLTINIHEPKMHNRLVRRTSLSAMLPRWNATDNPMQSYPQLIVTMFETRFEIYQCSDSKPQVKKIPIRFASMVFIRSDVNSSTNSKSFNISSHSSTVQVAVARIEDDCNWSLNLTDRSLANISNHVMSVCFVKCPCFF